MATRRPGLTKTQALRQAKSAALVKQYEERKETIEPPKVDLSKRRKKPVHEPKKIDFSKPGLTKTMLARMKHAEKIKQDYERKMEQQAAQVGRKPKRTPAPIGGDARIGRERVKGREPTQRRKALPTIPEKTRELAKTIKADVVRAEPIGKGPIDSIVIPPGSIKDNRTTIISIPQPAEVTLSQIANRSMQVISEILDEQDAAEAIAVQSKLDDLQQARRDFVVTVANVSGQVATLEDMTAVEPSTPPRYLQRVPDLDDPFLRVEYTIDHPIVEAAREFMKKTLVAMKESGVARKLDQEFKRIADIESGLDVDDELIREEELIHISDDDDIYVPPAVTHAPPRRIYKRPEYFQYPTFDPDELERFFRGEQCPVIHKPPFGREDLHPDLWELDDPWYIPPPEPDVPDFIQFD
ncbi:PREDICTED: uncharacterized protein LOC107066012 [Polistes dominula]|uniref:Uncharacterized protein LOC107066012 n=1 Tax=Polistes dominula TaxID=743375 RepID=A0ABM1I656_POLDO|nr:PREDICTED: uncharacterized protein LOC107066012 [Polistes dominula]